MRKITSLLMMFMLFVGMGWAEKVNGIEQTAINPANLTTGYYAIKCVNPQKTNHNGKFVKYNEATNGLEVATLGESTEENRNFVWYIQCNGKDQNKTITIKAATRMGFWPVPERQNLATLSSSAVNFKIDSGNDVVVGGTEPEKNAVPENAALIHEDATEGIGYFHLNEAGNGQNFPKVGCWDDTNNKSLLYAEFHPADFYPIVSSTLTQDGKFGEMHWYSMTLKNEAVVFEHFTGKTYIHNNYANKKTANKLFAFVGSEEAGYEIYNCVAGPSKILWSDGTPGTAGGNPIIMTEKTQAKTQTKFFLKPNGDGWGLYKEGNTTAYLNHRDNYLAYWVHPNSASDPGSRFQFNEVRESELPEYFNNFKTDLKRVEGCVGGCTTEDSKLIDAQMTNINNIGEFCNAHPFIPYVGNGLYYIRSQREIYNGTTDQSRFGHHLIATPTAAADGTIADTENNLDVTTWGHVGDLGAIWKFEGDANFKIKNMNCGKTLNRPVGGVLKCNSDVSFSLLPSRISDGVFSIKINNENKYFHDNNQNENIMEFNRNADEDFGSSYCLIPVKEITVNVSDAKWATICLPMAVTVPAGVTAYYVNDVVENVIHVQPLTEIPAQTPVLIFSETAKAYQFPVATTTVDALADGVNKLFGKTVKTAVTGAYYGLTKNTAGEAVFAPYASAAIPANKVLLPKDNVPAQSQNVQEFRINFGEATGIENVETSNGKSNIYYDLNGRRVLYPTQGIYVNGNGQKVFIK